MKIRLNKHRVPYLVLPRPLEGLEKDALDSFIQQGLEFGVMLTKVPNATGLPSGDAYDYHIVLKGALSDKEGLGGE